MKRNPRLSKSSAAPKAQPITETDTGKAGSIAFFRKRDWWCALGTFLAIWAVYLLTLAPEVTLEDSGELITGSVYAGIPHPPGYPVWTLYSWLWTVLVPFGNYAWRVALAEANAGAVACALITLMVSRGSTLLIESVEALKALPQRWETVISSVAGVVAGSLMGLDAFMWRESVAVNRMAVSSVPWFLLVLVCLMRWLNNRNQYRSLYWALFLFGLCFTTHQSLIVAAIGIEVLIAAADSRAGRDLFLGNGIIYLLYETHLWLTGHHLIHNLEVRAGLLHIFNWIGIGSLLIGGWLALKTRQVFSEWKPVLIMGLLWLGGAAFYFYMPLSCSTNPPMEWCYPRTVDGFIHAITRGQYEQPNPTDIGNDPGRFIAQLGMLVSGVADSFNWIGALFALVPFLFFRQYRRRERAWITGLTALYLCVGVFLMVLLNPTPDRASADLVKVFFNNSHTLVAALIGYGLALTAAYMTVDYERFRRFGLLGGGVAVCLALYCLARTTTRHYFGPAGVLGLWELPHWIGRSFAGNQYGLPVLASLLLLLVTAAFTAAMLLYRRHAPIVLVLALFALLPFSPALGNWLECSQRGHMFGYWYGHDMFSPPFKGADGKPLFPEIPRNSILFGGTDAGRFCPTYMIFCESFTPHKHQPKEDQVFDRRDVYIITQNALADPPYLNYIRAQYNRSAQIDPPFFSELCRAAFKDNEYRTNLLAQALQPLDNLCKSVGAMVENQRRTASSRFRPSDFVNLHQFASRLQPDSHQDPLSRYLYENLSGQTQKLVCASENEDALKRCLARDLNTLLDRDGQQNGAGAETSRETELLYSPERFKGIDLPPELVAFIHDNPAGPMRIRLNRLLLEAAYPEDIARSEGGLYPDREIYTPSPEDQNRAYQEYMSDVQRRLPLHQLRPGEEVEVVDNRIQIKGTVAVMALNGLLAKTIFDRNPDREFFIEESFPLDWMYPHLTPNGVIMKINRNQQVSFPQDLLRRDHEFWRQYSQRLTGDIVDYDTSVKSLCGWIEKTYLNYDLDGFKGDRKFVHDVDAQKCFSKLRTAIAGLYSWRLSGQCSPECRPRTNDEAQALLREANFAYMQAFAFSPWNPEAVLRYAGLLLQCNRLEDALLVAETCLKFDPYDGQVAGLAQQLRDYKKQASTSARGA